MKDSNVDNLAKKIYNYHRLNHKLEKADIIIGFTAIDLTIAEYSAELFKKGYAPLVLFAGKGPYDPKIKAKDHINQTNWGMTEAEKFAEVAEKNGVSKEKIFVEPRSTNSEENVTFSYNLLKEKGIIPKKIIVVQKPTMERRVYATFKNFWPEKDYELMVTSAPYTYEEYAGEIVDREQIIHIMVGDLQRIKVYPEKGFQIPQEIPNDVWEAYEKLVGMGYTRHLIRD